MKLLLASLKTPTNSKYCSKSRIRLLFKLYFAFINRFSPFQSTVMAGFRNRFQEYSWLSEQLLESQAVIGKPEQAQ
jgi:hypothetical protein